MVKSTSLLMTAMALCLCMFFGSSYLARADEAIESKPMGEITAYTTLPSATADAISAGYEAETKIRVN